MYARSPTTVSSSVGTMDSDTRVGRYETSSGGNTGLIISIGPFANGSVPSDQAAAAAALGDYVRRCYGAGKAVASGASSSASNRTITIAPAKPAEIDRVQIREDQSQGQLVRGFRLTAKLANGTTTVLCPRKATSIGNKFICSLDAPLVVERLSLMLTGAAAGTTPRITQFAAFRCADVADEIDTAWEVSSHGAKRLRLKTDDAASISWLSQPARSNSTVLVAGAGFTNGVVLLRDERTNVHEYS